MQGQVGTCPEEDSQDGERSSKPEKLATKIIHGKFQKFKTKKINAKE